jgi:hypothetical protein
MKYQDWLEDGEIDQWCNQLTKNTEEFIAMLKVDISGICPPSEGTARYKKASNSYECLAYAKSEFPGVKSKTWEDARSDGRCGDFLMNRLAGICTRLRELGECCNSSEQRGDVILD